MKKWLFGLFSGILVASVVYAASGTIQTWTGKGSRRGTVEMELVSPSVGSAANLVPGTNNANSLGTLTLQWKDVFVAGSLTIPQNAAPRTNVTPTSVGQLILNTTPTPDQLCFSTGTAVSTWVQVADGSSACSN
ncbi:MAG: hypothetical protein EKK55_17415 [Rhodocyclaceae bacterium]|nr:MAG: hypothetical protein EKK55_17415 [Rhodocyclaceae bacterium]